jgi:chromosome segregation protein
VKLAHVDLCGFRGYQKRIRIEFAECFTIIDGRNGVGKSTIFDAIEFALTGTLSKYNEAKASGETVADYFWWTGDGKAPEDRYVEVGFRDESEELQIRRTQFGKTDDEKLVRITNKLCDPALAPHAPLKQLCSTSIIRDEHIASLSLDLKETERYALLRDALGANDADDWIKRASRLVELSKRRLAAAQQEVTSVNTEGAVAARRIDEVRANLVAESSMAAAVERLRAFAVTEAAPDRLAGPVRERLAVAAAQTEALQSLIDRWQPVAKERLRLDDLARSQAAADLDKEQAAVALAAIPQSIETSAASALAVEARDLIALVALGRKIGLKDGACPLCATGQSDADFHRGTAVAEAIARRLDEEAAREAEREQAGRIAGARLAAAEARAQAVADEHVKAVGVVEGFDRDCKAQGFDNDVTLDIIRSRQAELRKALENAQKDLRILETLRLSGDLVRAQRAEAEAKDRLARTQERFGRALKAEATAQALFDAARRAAGETLDQRLDRVLPLLSELYRRLRPHPIWREIEYSIRGDVRRFLKLQVGGNLNPQFLFSSGQRRATGLAFLLSINISLAWSRWRSILLDDPVQHVDDFRTVHLAEVTAQLVSEDRQIICAVEDAALADLLCRRLPIRHSGDAKRITLGLDADGALAKVYEGELNPLIRRSLVATQDQSVAAAGDRRSN